MNFVGNTMRITTPWGQANVLGQSVVPLLDLRK